MKRLALAIALSALLATAAAAQQLTKVRVAYDGFSMTSGPLNYADKQGIFKQFGLDVTPVFVEGGSTLTPAVVGGSLDIAQNGYTPALAAAVAGRRHRHHRRHFQQAAVPARGQDLDHQCGASSRARRSRSAATARRPTPRPISRSRTSSSHATT